MRRGPVILAAVAAAAAAAGCERVMYDPAKATRPYPHDLHEPSSIDVQVFRDGPTLEIVNSTPRSYAECDVWINQRYVSHLEALPAGKTVRMSLWDFYDELGDRFSAGGFWRTERPVAVRLVELQTAEDEPLVGLVAIPRTEPGK